MKILILSGGCGLRMRPYTDIIPKCLLHVKGIPCVRLIIEDIKKQLKDAEIILCINKKFETHFKHEFRDMDLEYSITQKPSGTAGEVWYARNLLVNKEPFIIIYGDDLTKINYQKFYKLHKEYRDTFKTLKTAGTLAISTKYPMEAGVVLTEGERIYQFKEKPIISETLWTGKCILEPHTINYCSEGLDMAKDVFPKILEHNLVLWSYINNNIWLDVGILSHYKRANQLYQR